MSNKFFDREDMVVSIDCTKAIIPKSRFTSIDEREINYKFKKKNIVFKKVEKWKLTRPISDSYLKNATNYIFTGTTWFSIERIDEIKKILESLNYYGSYDYDIYEYQHKKGDFPIILSFQDEFFFLLAPIKINDAIK